MAEDCRVLFAPACHALDAVIPDISKVTQPRRPPMMLIVMLISLSVHYGPATISGFDTLEGCRAAQPIVVAFYKKTTTSVVKTECVELPR
jgi:hypothetical protein